MLRILKIIMLLLIGSSAFGQYQPWQTMPFNYRMKRLKADSGLIVPRLTSLNSGVSTVDSVGALFYYNTDNSLYVKTNTGVKALSFSGGTASNIYNTSGILNGNRTLTGMNNTYSLTFDSIGFFNVNANGFTNIAALGVEKTYIVHQYDNIGLRISDPGVPYVDVTLQRSDTSFAVTVANKGTLKKLIMQQDTLSFNGKLVLPSAGNPGVGRVLVDSTGTGMAVWRNSTPTSPGTPTFTPTGSANSILGTGYSLNITGSGDHMRIQLTTGTSITTSGTIGTIVLATPYSSTPIVVGVASEVGSIGAPVGFNAISASNILMFSSSNLTPSKTYYFNLISGL
jgi:hypothetical protein